ncbi:hypothetical protein GQ600_20867 [Phytophthora cactorum]|nr:hypothetical protein GQ600_20867 [Phytophthora cactorum]
MFRRTCVFTKLGLSLFPSRRLKFKPAHQ